jgi:hypothetical protein
VIPPVLLPMGGHTQYDRHHCNAAGASLGEISDQRPALHSQLCQRVHWWPWLLLVSLVIARLDSGHGGVSKAMQSGLEHEECYVTQPGIMLICPDSSTIERIAAAHFPTCVWL